MRRLLLLPILAALACGGSNDPVLDPAFAGTWTGTTTITFPGYAPFYSSGQLLIAVSGQDANVTEICPDGSGGVTATGTGENAAWSGTYACPAVALGTCASVAITYTSASAILSNTTLSVVAAGTASGCGTTSDVTVSFSGGK